MEEILFDNLSFKLCTEEIIGPQRDSLYIIVPIIVIYVMIFLTGTVGNISTCIVISRNKSMHTATNYYLFSLAVSDLLLLLSGLPQEVYLIYSRYPYIFGSAFCFMRGMFAETSANATVLTITAFTVERYLAICHPFLSHTMSKLSRAVKLILTIWLVAVCLAVPQAMQFQIVGPPECEMCQFARPIIKHSFEVSTFLFFVLPMTLITVLYVLIGHRLKSSNMMKRRNGNIKVPNNSSRKVVKMLVAVVVAFFICWAPFHAQRLYFMYAVPLTTLDHETRSLYSKIYDIVTYISGILYYISATINPILYNIMSVKFREAFKETFARCCGFGHLKAKRPERSYSVLSRSAHRGPTDTTVDFGRDEPVTHTTITQRNSLEFANTPNSNMRRTKSCLSAKSGRIEEENRPCIEWTNATSTNTAAAPKPHCDNVNHVAKLLTVSVGTPPPRKIGKIWQYFECLAKRTIDDNQRLSSYCSSPHKDSNILFELNSIPNKKQIQRTSSACVMINGTTLKDVVKGAVEDELTSYMNEVRTREYCN